MSNEDIKNAQVRAGEEAVMERLRGKGLLSEPEPDPIKNENTPVWDLVIADMQERDKVGEQRYGVRLSAGNGRDALVDAYQEGLDLVVYLRQEIEERFKIIFQIVGWLAEAGIQMPERGTRGRAIQLNAVLADIQAAIQDLWSIKIERDTLLREREGEVWFWSTGDPEDGDNAETITCPILIQPETLRVIINQGKADLQLACEIDRARDEIAQTIPPNPLPMILHCPRCGLQHVDEEESLEEYTQRLYDIPTATIENTPRWTNPPHKSHLCSKCKCVWRPAEVPTVGVELIINRGERDTWP